MNALNLVLFLMESKAYLRKIYEKSFFHILIEKHFKLLGEVLLHSVSNNQPTIVVIESYIHIRFEINSQGFTCTKNTNTKLEAVYEWQNVNYICKLYYRKRNLQLSIERYEVDYDS